MAVGRQHPPWFHRIHQAITDGWQHQGPCSRISLTSAFDDERRLWRLFAAPVHQEVFGGE